jgi:hypothetical protein
MKTRLNHIIVFVIILLACFSKILLSQYTEPTEMNKANFTYSDTLITKILKNEFGNIVTNETKTNLGNFASIDIKEAKMKVAGNIFLSKGSILGIKASGGVSEGASALMNGTKVSPSIGIELDYSIYTGRKREFGTDKSILDVYQLRLDSLQKAISLEFETGVTPSGEFVKKAGNLNLNKPQDMNTAIITKKVIPFFIHEKTNAQKIKLHNEKVKKAKTEKAIDKVIQAISNKKITIDGGTKDLSDSDLIYYSLKKDSLCVELEKYKSSIIQIEKTLSIYSDVTSIYSEYNQKRNEYIEKKKEIEMCLKPEEYKISWLSFGYEINNKAFRLFNESLELEDQITKESFNSHIFKVQFSTYNLSYKKLETYYFTYGLAFQINDNLDDLTSFEIVNTKQLGNTSGESVSLSKFEVYNSNEYLEQNNSLKLFADLYWFIAARNSLALHLYPECGFTYKDRRYFMNLGQGIFFSFQSKDKEKSVANIELYYNIRDLFKESSENDFLIDRSFLSLRFHFPIPFRTNNK